MMRARSCRKIACRRIRVLQISFRKTARCFPQKTFGQIWTLSCQAVESADVDEHCALHVCPLQLNSLNNWRRSDCGKLHEAVITAVRHPHEESGRALATNSLHFSAIFFSTKHVNRFTFLSHVQKIHFASNKLRVSPTIIQWKATSRTPEQCNVRGASVIHSFIGQWNALVNVL